MSKLTRGLIVGAVALAPACASAAIGPHAGECGGERPAMLVKVIGLKARSGALRVQSYGGAPKRFFDKGTYLERIDVAVPPAGPVEVCMPVRGPGTYAISVRHDANGNGSTDMGDGAGMSGNPAVSMMDVLFRRKPAPARVSVAVAGTTPVPVVMNYVHGMSVGPVADAGGTSK